MGRVVGLEDVGAAREYVEGNGAVGEVVVVVPWGSLVNNSGTELPVVGMSGVDV